MVRSVAPSPTPKRACVTLLHSLALLQKHVRVRAAAAETDEQCKRECIGAQQIMLHKGGSTLLHLGAKLNYDMTRVLRPVCAEAIDTKDDLGRTPLHVAAQVGGSNATAALLQIGADVTATTNKTGFTPLHLAAASRYASRRLLVVGQLIRAGADPCAKSKRTLSTKGLRLTPLHYAQSRGDVSAPVRDLLTCTSTHLIDISSWMARVHGEMIKIAQAVKEGIMCVMFDSCHGDP